MLTKKMRLTKKTIEFKTEPVENKCLNKENRKGNEHKIRKVKFKSISQQSRQNNGKLLAEA